MFAIQINNTFLILPAEAQLQFNWKNHLFSEQGIIPGSFSIPLDVEANDHNLQLLGNPDILEAQNKPFRRIPATLFLGDDGAPAPYKKGEIKIRAVNSKRVSINFATGLATLGSSFTDQSIRNYARHQFTITNERIQKRIILRAINPLEISPSKPRSISVNGQSFTGNYGAQLANEINDGQEEVTVNLKLVDIGTFNEFELTFTPRTDITDLQAPMHIVIPDDEVPRWRWIDGEGDKYTKNLIQNYSEAVLPWFNTYMTAEPECAILRFPSLHIPNFYEPQAKAVAMANYSVETGVFALNSVKNLNAYNVNSAVPCVRLMWIFGQIERNFNLTIAGDLFEREDIEDLIFIPQNSLDEPQKFIGNTALILWRLSFNVADFLPDVSANEMVKQIANALCMEIDYNPISRTIYLNHKGPIITEEPVADLTPNAAPYEPRTIEEISSITFKPAETKEEQELRLKLAPANNPFLPFTYKPEGLEPESEQTISIDISSCPMAQVRPGNFSLFVPQLLGKSAEIFGLRWLFWRGVRASNAGNEYPFASLQSDSLSLSFYGSTGLFAQRWKAWASFLTNRNIIEIQAYFDVAAIMKHSAKDIYLYDRMAYLIAEMGINANQSHLEDSRMLLYSLPTGRTKRQTAWRALESSAYCLTADQEPEDPAEFQGFPIRWGRIDAADAPVLFDDDGNATLNPAYNPPSIAIIEALDGAGVGTGLRYADNRLGRYDGINGNAGYLAFFFPSDFGEPQFFINNYPQSAWQAFDYPNYEYIEGEEAPYTLYLSHTVQNSAIDLFEVR